MKNWRAPMIALGIQGVNATFRLLARVGAGIVLVWMSATAQTPVFRPHSIKELGNVRINTVFQDNRGWLWFGAQGGLYRYDGLGFQSIGLSDSTQMGTVSAVFEAQGRIWVGFQDGKIGYVSSKSTFIPSAVDSKKHIIDYSAQLQIWQPEEGLPGKTITAFADDHRGGFWIATYGEGLYCLKSNRLYQFGAEDDGLVSNDIYTITSDSLGRIWAATDGGISICSMTVPGKKTVQNLSTAKDGLPDEIITALATDIHGNILIGTYERGVCRYNVAKQSIENCTPNWNFGPVTALTSFGSSQIWIGTANEGVVCAETNTGELRPLPQGQTLRRSKVLAMCKDREGLLWVVCDKGLIYDANVRFGLLETPFTDIQSIYTDSRHRFWVGTPNGLFLKDNSTFRQVLPQKQNVLALWEAFDGNVWVGTFGNGVFIVNQQGKVVRHLTEQDGLANGSVLSISGSGQRVWLATLGGVTSLDLDRSGRIGHIGHQNELGTSYVYKVFCDSKGRIWFGTDGKGLVMLENNTFKYFTEASGFPLKTIYTVTEDRKGNIWFSSDKTGLFSYNGQTFKRITTENHLHSLAITSLAADANGQIIIGYEDGVDLLNPDRKDHVTFCDASIGVPQVAVNLNAMCRDAQGNILLGGRQGILRISAYDEHFLDDPQPGITAVSVFLQPIDYLGDNTLKYNENYLIFNFTGLWYTNPESVRYLYRLEGFDPDWKISKDHLASYPKLPPGNYVFRVQTSEHGNFDHVPEASWAFTIEQPFWTRWWFVLLCFAASTGIFYAFVHSREARLRREASVKREKVESQFAALKSQINPHFLFNSFNTLITIIEEDPKLAVEYVEHLSDFYRTMMVYNERDVIPLQEELGLVRNFDFLLKKRYEDSFSLNASVNGQSGSIMPLTLQMLVENAVKHNVISKARPLTVEIFIENGEYVVVRNNIQRKIKPEKGTHFGLQSLKYRYQLIGERPVLIEENEGFFTVKVPIIR